MIVKVLFLLNCESLKYIAKLFSLSILVVEVRKYKAIRMGCLDKLKCKVSYGTCCNILKCQLQEYLGRCHIDKEI